MEPLSERSSLATAHYRFLDLSNSEPEPDPDGPDWNGRIVAQGDGHVYIRCVENIARARLTVRFWPGGPPPESGWQEACVARLERPGARRRRSSGWGGPPRSCRFGSGGQSVLVVPRLM